MFSSEQKVKLYVLLKKRQKEKPVKDPMDERGSSESVFGSLVLGAEQKFENRISSLEGFSTKNEFLKNSQLPC